MNHLPSFPPSFPPVDAAIGYLARVNWVRHLERFVLLIVTIAAVVTALSQFTYRAARKFWADHGDEVTLRFLIFVDNLETAIEVTHNAAQSARPIVNRWVARIADRAFYAAVDWATA